MGDFFRIGDKLLNRTKLDGIVDRIFDLRISGLSQQEVAQRVGCDRTFISRLESLAEIRKGGSLAVIGFPLGNTEELEHLCQELGVEYTLRSLMRSAGSLSSPLTVRICSTGSWSSWWR